MIKFKAMYQKLFYPEHLTMLQNCSLLTLVDILDHYKAMAEDYGNTDDVKAYIFYLQRVIAVQEILINRNKTK